MKYRAFFAAAMPGIRLRILVGMVVCGVVLATVAACSSREEDEPFAGVYSESFVFEESASSTNWVDVVANTSWEVYWTPASAQVKVSPLTGRGRGQFRIEEMPRATSIQIGVRSTGGGTSGGMITVTRE